MYFSYFELTYLVMSRLILPFLDHQVLHYRPKGGEYQADPRFETQLSLQIIHS